MLVYLNGLMLGLSLITALGPQNVFLIRQGALKNHAIMSAIICFCCDVILVIGSVAGLNQLLNLHPVLHVWIIWFGVAFLAYYGTNALRKGLARTNSETIEQKQTCSRLQIILLALGFSLLNPHAIIDSLVIIGSGSRQYPDHPYFFLMGVVTSSFLWFTSLTFTTHRFADLLARQAIWQRIELGSGILMLALSLKLAGSQF